MILVAIALAVLLSLVALAQFWSRTPHGRLKPIFALAFRLQALADKSVLDGVLALPMETAEKRAAVRAKFLEDVAPLAKPVSFDGAIEDKTIDGAGGALPIRIYTPSGNGPFPCVVYMHGGGFIVGSPSYTDGLTRAIASAAPAVVVSVDYRLAPESPWPAAVEDSERVLEWCLANARELNIQDRALAVAGDSAGGNLAAVLAQGDRNSGRGCVGLQVLIYPTVDGSRLDRDSQVAFARGFGLTTRDIEVCFARYVQERTALTDPAVSPLYAKSLADLAPALVFTAGFDVLRDEGIAYVERLAEAGVEVDHVHEPEMPHGYITMTRVCSEAAVGAERIAGAVRELGERNRQA